MDIHSFSDLVTATWTSALTLVELGGSVVAVQLVSSTIGFAMVLYKILQFTGISTGRFRTAERAIDLWGAGDTEQATKLLSKSRLALARDLQFGLQNLAYAPTAACYGHWKLFITSRRCWACWGRCWG